MTRSLVSLAVLTMVAAMAVPVPAQCHQVHLLILTPWEFEDELVPLKSWKVETGRPTEIVTIGEIEEIDLYDVRDLPEKIKRFIADYVTTHQVEHVMLVGDSDQFPVRYVKAMNTEWGVKYYPSDLYYMDLFKANGDFDDWDGNGNGAIGEMDFAGGTDVTKVNVDSIDMYPDISLARVPASTEAEVTTYVSKVIAYESSAKSAFWFRNVALVVDGGSGAFGAGSKMDGVVPYLSGFNVTKMYQDNAPYSSMTDAQRATALNTKLNSGVGFLSVYGHMNKTQFAGWYDETKLSGLTNSAKLPIVFTTGCYPGRFHFDLNDYQTRNGSMWTGTSNFPEPAPVQPYAVDNKGYESFAEQLLVKSATGAIGYVGNVSKTEHGAWLSATRGLNLYFYQQYASGTRTLGEMWAGALTTFVNDLYDPTTGGMYYFEFLHIHKMFLFGDPSLAVPYLPKPDVKVNGSDSAVTTGTGSTVTVTVSLTSGTFGGATADWWLVAETPSGWWSYVPGYNVWLPGLFASYQGPLFDLGTSQVFSGTLPAGTNRYYFGVDTNPNGTVDFDQLSFDVVQVTVN